MLEPPSFNWVEKLLVRCHYHQKICIVVVTARVGRYLPRDGNYQIQSIHNKTPYQTITNVPSHRCVVSVRVHFRKFTALISTDLGSHWFVRMSVVKQRLVRLHSLNEEDMAGGSGTFGNVGYSLGYRKAESISKCDECLKMCVPPTFKHQKRHFHTLVRRVPSALTNFVSSMTLFEHESLPAATQESEPHVCTVPSRNARNFDKEEALFDAGCSRQETGSTETPADPVGWQPDHDWDPAFGVWAIFL